MSTIKQEKRELLIVVILIGLCLFSAVIGLFTLNKRSENLSSKEETKTEILSNFTGMQDHIALVALEGPIFDGVPRKSPFSMNTDAVSCKVELEKALEDKRTKAVLIRANSPGGTVAASQELYQAIINLREAKKPVVISMGDVCASGCYYLASAADSIVANKGTLTGSIGVISQGVNYMNLMEKIGLKDQTFKAGQFKDLGSGQRMMTKKEKDIYQSLLDDSYDQFLSDIEAGRNIERAKLEQIAQGLIYTGDQALAVNLVDHIGTLRDAKDITKKILEEKYKYKKAKDLKFKKTWDKNELSSLDTLFGIKFKLPDFKALIPSNVMKIQSHKFQPLWILD